MPQDEKTDRGAGVRVGPVVWSVRDGALTGRQAITPAVVVDNLLVALIMLGLLAAALYLFLNGLIDTHRYGPLHQDGPNFAGRDVTAGGALAVGLIAAPALAFGVVAVMVGTRRFPVVLRPDYVELRVNTKESGRVLVRLQWDDVVDVHLITTDLDGPKGKPRTKSRVELVLRPGAAARNPNVGVVPTDQVVTAGPAQTAAVLHHFCHHSEDRALLGSTASQQVAVELAERAQ